MVRPALFILLLKAATMSSVSAFVPHLSKGRAQAARVVSSRLLSSTKKSSVEVSSILAPRLEGLDRPTVWHEFSPLANEYGSVNLGQGFPDWDPPQFCVDAMYQAVNPSFGRNANQYARSYAHMPLAKVLAEDYSKRWNMEINPVTQVGTAVGCTNALYCTLQGLLAPGDEVLLLEPAFDIYFAQVQMAGGIPRFCPLRPIGDPADGASAHFQLDMAELEASITPRTKVLLLNTPHNPTGKIFSRKELTQIAEILLERHSHVTVVSDEVYEHIVFDEEKEPHISMATIPGMFDRTLTLSSSGKTFSCTGWKVGWAVGPEHLVKAMTAVQQWCNFSVATPNQDAIALSLQRAREPYTCPTSNTAYDSFYQFLADDYRRKRGLLMTALETAGMAPICPPGGFFIMADTSGIDFPYDIAETTTAMPCSPMPRDWSLSRWMTKEVGVTAIPPSAFYSPANVPLAKNLLRFAFCKGDDTILEGHKRLENYFGGR
jgi:kynurenine--oxoglutarate transaminase/cysteine-S-conjugate beta-lyase/glutamine--phenylpyruvate transaminase